MASLNKSSFCSFVKNTRLVRVPPPSCHIISRVTGGLAMLYKQVKHPPPETNVYVSCTDENGIFNPGLLQKVTFLAKRYKYVKVLGSGISSVLIQAIDTYRRDCYQVAIKVLHTEYKIHGYQEADTVLRLNRVDPSNFSRVVKLKNTFMFGSHFCMVYELLHPSPLYKVIDKDFPSNKKLNLIRKIALQLLQVLGFLSQAGVIHADLKPENILFCSDDLLEGIKVVDFGNAIHCIFKELCLYYDDFQLQTIIYRAPEVAFGLPFGPEIDMWSVGCILAELYIGEPLFPAQNNDVLLTRMVGLLGPLPSCPFSRGKFHTDLKGFIGKAQPAHVTMNKISHYLKGSPDFDFVTFLFGILKYNPDERMSVSEAFQHAFIAPEVAGRFLVPAGLNTSSSYSSMGLDSSLYTKSPEVSADIAKECLFGVDLLRRGTFRRAVAEVPPFIPKKRSPSLKICPENSVNTSKTESRKNPIITGTAARLRKPETNHESQINDAVNNSHKFVSPVVYGSPHSIYDNISEIDNCPLSSEVSRGILISEVDLNSPVSSSDHSLTNESPGFEVNTGFDSQVNKCIISDDEIEYQVNTGSLHKQTKGNKAKYFNEKMCIHTSNMECNDTKEDNLSFEGENQDINELHESDESGYIFRIDAPSRKINKKGSSSSFKEHLHSNKEPLLKSNTASDVTTRKPENMCKKDSNKIKKINSKLSVNRSSTTYQRSERQRFKHFEKSRQVLLKRCIRGFKELINETNSEKNDINEDSEDPCDFDRLFNDIKKPVHSFHGKQQKSKLEFVKNVQYECSKEDSDKKELKVDLKDLKNDGLCQKAPSVAKNIYKPANKHNKQLEMESNKNEIQKKDVKITPNANGLLKTNSAKRIKRKARLGESSIASIERVEGEKKFKIELKDGKYDKSKKTTSVKKKTKSNNHKGNLFNQKVENEVGYKNKKTTDILSDCSVANKCGSKQNNETICLNSRGTDIKGSNNLASNCRSKVQSEGLKGKHLETTKLLPPNVIRYKLGEKEIRNNLIRSRARNNHVMEDVTDRFMENKLGLEVKSKIIESEDELQLISDGEEDEFHAL